MAAFFVYIVKWMEWTSYPDTTAGAKNDTLDISYLPVYVTCCLIELGNTFYWLWLLKRYINELHFVTSTNEDILITVTC